jgi:transposase
MCQAAILDEDGKLLDEIRFANTPEEIEEFSGKLTTFHDDVKAVVESTGNLWIQIHDRLEEHGFVNLKLNTSLYGFFLPSL